MQGFIFPKSEKILSKYDIDLLFTKVNYVRHGSYGMRYVWRDIQEDEPPTRVLIVVPKKRIKKAVDRQRIKRQLREVYRLNKGMVANPTTNQTLLIAIVYQGKISPDYSDLDSSFHKMAKAMKAKIDKP